MRMIVASLMISGGVLANFVTEKTEKPSIEFGTVVKGTFVPKVTKVKIPLWEFPSLEPGHSEECSGFHVRVKPEDCDETGTALEITPLDIRTGVRDHVPVCFGLTGGRHDSITVSATVISDISVDKSHFDFSSVSVRHGRSQSIQIRGPADFRLTGVPECVPGMSFELQEKHTAGTSVSILTLRLSDEFDYEFQGIAYVKCKGIESVSQFPLFIDCPSEVELSSGRKIAIHTKTNEHITLAAQRLRLRYGARVRSVRSRLFSSAFSAMAFSGDKHCYVKSQISTSAANAVIDGTATVHDIWLVELEGGREVPIDVVYDFRKNGTSQ